MRKKKTNASKVTNGRKYFLPVMPGVDGRSPIARRVRDIFQDLTSDLGGIDLLSTAQLQLCRRCALLSVTCETIEAEYVAGERVDTEAFGKASERLRRLLQTLGLKRVPRDVKL